MLVSVLTAAFVMAALLCLTLAIEWPTQLYRVSWASRLRGVQFSLVKAVCVVVLTYPLSTAWSSLGIEPVHINTLVESGPLRLGLALALTFLALDFLMYWHHRFMHRFFWPVHATHHAIRDLSGVNSYAHFAETITEFLLIAIPLSFIAWDTPATPLAVSLAFRVAPFWIHSPTRLRLSWLGPVFVTPRFHRIHHSLEPRHFDKNFGITFSFWDRMFGTAYIPSPKEWPEVGIDGHDEARSVMGYILHPIIYLRSSPPHDDSDLVVTRSDHRVSEVRRDGPRAAPCPAIKSSGSV